MKYLNQYTILCTQYLYEKKKKNPSPKIRIKLCKYKNSFKQKNLSN